MGKIHKYQVSISWTGDTSTYTSYKRDHEIRCSGKSTILGSSDPAFRGDASRWNPEDLLVASLSACHKLWYLHLCAAAGVVVTGYVDNASGEMVENPDGSGQFRVVTLHPRVTISCKSNSDIALKLHHDAHEKCFIARSVAFPVECNATISHDES